MAGASFIVRALQCYLNEVSVCDSEVLFLVWGGLFFGFGGRDARPYVTSVRVNRCPASALKWCTPGPFGDASGSFSLVLASV